MVTLFFLGGAREVGSGKEAPEGREPPRTDPQKIAICREKKGSKLGESEDEKDCVKVDCWHHKEKNREEG